jgi:hypothetical protein
MNFIKATLAWVGIGAVLGVGLWLLAVKGSPWLFALATVGFILAIGKIGCQAH